VSFFLQQSFNAVHQLSSFDFSGSAERLGLSEAGDADLDLKPQCQILPDADIQIKTKCSTA